MHFELRLASLVSTPMSVTVSVPPPLGGDLLDAAEDDAPWEIDEGFARKLVELPGLGSCDIAFDVLATTEVGQQVELLPWSATPLDDAPSWYPASTAVAVVPRRLRLTGPPADGVLVPGASLTLGLSAIPEGTARVEYYDGLQRLAVVDEPPFEWTWMEPPRGIRMLHAKSLGQAADGAYTATQSSDCTALIVDLEDPPLTPPPFAAIEVAVSPPAVWPNSAIPVVRPAVLGRTHANGLNRVAGSIRMEDPLLLPNHPPRLFLWSPAGVQYLDDVGHGVEVVSLTESDAVVVRGANSPAIWQPGGWIQQLPQGMLALDLTASRLVLRVPATSPASGFTLQVLDNISPEAMEEAQALAQPLWSQSFLIAGSSRVRQNEQGDIVFRNLAWRSTHPPSSRTLLGVASGHTAVAMDVNDAGTVVGTSIDAAQLRSACTWQLSEHLSLQAARLPGVDRDSVANAVNSSCVVVGMQSGSDGVRRGFLHVRGRTLLLDDLVALPEGIRVTNAVDILDDGRILVEASNGGAFVLIPNS